MITLGIPLASMMAATSSAMSSMVKCASPGATVWPEPRLSGLMTRYCSLKVARIRLPWLLLNLAGLLLTGLLLEHFQVTLKQALFLLTFVPVVMGMGGSIGSQTATFAVRGLATGRLGPDAGGEGRFLWQQLKVAAALGFVCSLVVAVAAFLLEQNLYYALVVGVSLLLAVTVAAANGVTIPVLFKRLGIDPAVASAPLVTTTNDIIGILIYFGLASLLIDFLVR